MLTVLIGYLTNSQFNHENSSADVVTAFNGPQIRICLFTLRPIASRQLNSLTSIYTLSWLGGAVVTHPIWLKEVQSSIPGSGKGFNLKYT